MGSDTPEQRAARGDPDAFTALMAATKADLYRFVRRYVGDEDEALDLVQEAYAAAWLGIRRYDPTRPFEAWLRTITLNKCRDWSRRRRVRRLVRGVIGLDAPEAVRVADPSPGVEAQAEDRRRVAELSRALDALPHGLRAPLLLATLEGRSQTEIGRMMGLTSKAVELRIARARAQLRAALNVPVE